MMVQAKRIYILIIKFNKLFSFNFFFAVFPKRNRKHVLCFYWVIKTLVNVWENWRSCGNSHLHLVFPQHFLFSQTFTLVSITWLVCVTAVSFPFPNACKGDENWERGWKIKSRGRGEATGGNADSIPPHPLHLLTYPLPTSPQFFAHPRHTPASLATWISPPKWREMAAT